MTHPRTRFARPLKGASLADRQSRIRGDCSIRTSTGLL
jgi:hypothetical protein